MPAGTVLNPSGPSDDTTMGQILRDNGEVIRFFNITNLDINDPVIFDIRRGNVSVNSSKEDTRSFTGKMPIAIIPDGLYGSELDPPWSNELKQRWIEEWNAYESDKDIENRFKRRLKRSVKNHPKLTQTQ